MTSHLPLSLWQLPLAVVLVVLLAVVVAGTGGGLHPTAVVGHASAAGATPGPGMREIHLYEALGDGTSLQLYGSTIAPAPSRLGPFVSWLRPVLAVAEARVVIDGPAGEQVVVTGNQCRLSKDGREITFQRHVRWYRGDLDQVVHCRRIVLKLDDRAAVFERGAYLQGVDDRWWEPFKLQGFFAPFPTLTLEAREEGSATPRRGIIASATHLIARLEALRGLTHPDAPALRTTVRRTAATGRV